MGGSQLIRSAALAIALNLGVSAGPNWRPLDPLGTRRCCLASLTPQTFSASSRNPDFPVGYPMTVISLWCSWRLTSSTSSWTHWRWTAYGSGRCSSGYCWEVLPEEQAEPEADADDDV